jgi:hypothetical protein
MNYKPILYLAFILGGHCQGGIIFPKAAEECQPVAYQETLSFYRAAPAFFPKDFQTNGLQVAWGHHCYSSDYKDVLSGKMLTKEETSPGWEYFMMRGTNMVGRTGGALDATNHWEWGGSIFRGPAGNGKPDPILVGWQVSEKLPQVQIKDYEFRYLWVGVDRNVELIWLHGLNDDILIPIEPVYPGDQWKAYQPYSESELVRLFKPKIEDGLKSGGNVKSTNGFLVN